MLFFLEISDFLGAANLGEVITNLSTNPDDDCERNEPKFIAEPMRDEHKDDVIKYVYFVKIITDLTNSTPRTMS